jgi:hypothetical protein
MLAVAVSATLGIPKKPIYSLLLLGSPAIGSRLVGEIGTITDYR